MLWRKRSAAQRARDFEAAKPVPAAQPSTLPPGSPELDSFVAFPPASRGPPPPGGPVLDTFVHLPPAGGPDGGTGVVAGADVSGPHTPSPLVAGGLAAAAAAGGAAAVALQGAGSGASTPQTTSLLPADYATFNRWLLGWLLSWVAA